MKINKKVDTIRLITPIVLVILSLCMSFGQDDDLYDVVLSIQNIDTVAGTFEIYMNSNAPVAGYQFHMNDINVDSLSEYTPVWY